MKNISTFTCIYILNSKSKLIYRRSLIKNDDPEFYPTHIPTAFKDFVVTNLTREAAQITQCTSFSGATGGCDTSLFQISDIAWLNISGTQNTDVLASLQCSGAAPCTSVTQTASMDYDRHHAITFPIKLCHARLCSAHTSIMPR